MDETKGSKGLSIAALILGILSMLCCCIGFPFAIIGLILAIIALVKNNAGKGLAIAGLITSVITLIISGIMAVSIIPFAPYFEDFAELSENADAVIEEYEEDGTYPEVVDKLIEDGLMDEETAKIFMDNFVQGYKSGAGK